MSAQHNIDNHIKKEFTKVTTRNAVALTRQLDLWHAKIPIFESFCDAQLKKGGNGNGNYWMLMPEWGGLPLCSIAVLLLLMGDNILMKCGKKAEHPAVVVKLLAIDGLSRVFVNAELHRVWKQMAATGKNDAENMDFGIINDAAPEPNDCQEGQDDGNGIDG